MRNSNYNSTILIEFCLTHIHLIKGISIKMMVLWGPLQNWDSVVGEKLMRREGINESGMLWVGTLWK